MSTSNPQLWTCRRPSVDEGGQTDVAAGNDLVEYDAQAAAVARRVTQIDFYDQIGQMEAASDAAVRHYRSMLV